jgi:hypothetical protein
MRDIHLRIALRRELLSRYRTDPDTVIIEELGVHHGASRIDLAVVNGVMHGYELKSERDSLLRFSAQALAYSAVFDLVTLVVAERHVNRAAEVAPEWWGIRVARIDSGRLFFRDLKLAMKNPSADPMSVASLLWRDEALSFLEELGGAKGMRSKSRLHIYLKLIERADFDGLRDRVRQCLKARKGWRSVETRRSCGD